MLAMRNIANQEPVVFSYICFPLQDLADNYISSAAITLPFLSFFSFPHSICLIPFLPRQPQLCSSIVRGSGVKTSDWRRKVSDFTSTFFSYFVHKQQLHNLAELQSRSVRPQWIFFLKKEKTKFSIMQSHSPFSFLSREMNFLGGITPTFFFCVAMLLNRSAKQVSRDSLRRGCTWREEDGDSQRYTVKASATQR